MGEKAIGNYRLVSEIGRGGMGIVYKAEQTNLGRYVALKVLYPHLVADPIIVKRFNYEARATALLNHANIVQIYDVGVEENQHFLSMEYFPGRTLASVLEERGRLSPEETMRIADQVAAALGAAHDVGIIHRDIKPSNILIDDHGRVKVTDFGIAVAAGQGDLTDEGHLVGTARYMSPEQVRGDDLDGRSDLYSLGIVIYEMLTGEVPFDHEGSPLAVLAMHVGEPVPPMEGVPLAAESLVQMCLEKRREQRPGTATAFRKALRERSTQLEWKGHPLPPLESAEDEGSPGMSFRYDRAGVVRSAIDTMTISLAERLQRKPREFSRFGRWLLNRLGRRFKIRRDSCKLERVEIMKLKERLIQTETRLDEAKRDCERSHAAYEATEAMYHELAFSESQVRPLDADAPGKASEEQQRRLYEQIASGKKAWRDLEAKVRDLYADVERIRSEYAKSSANLVILRQIRDRLAAESGITRRNRTLLILFLALVLGACGVWVFGRAALRKTPPDTKAPLVYGEFQTTGTMQTARGGHAAALLDGDSVLVSGGIGVDNIALDTAEVFHRTTGEWVPAGKMLHARYNHTMTALLEGKGLVAIGGSQRYRNPDATDSVERFMNGRFVEISPLKCARTRHQSTILLSDGRVLVTGGCDERGKPLDTAEIFTPETNSSRLLRIRMKTARSDHTATPLPDGRVVIMGGNRHGMALDGVEVFNPVTEEFDSVCSLKDPRYGHTATAIDGNRILVIGGQRGHGPDGTLDTIELVDIENRTSSIVGRLLGPRKAHTAVLLPGTRMLLVAGGSGLAAENENSCEFYSLGWWGGKVAGQLDQGRNTPTLTLLADGSVLFAGGFGVNSGAPLATTEIYVKVPESHKSPSGSTSLENRMTGKTP